MQKYFSNSENTVSNKRNGILYSQLFQLQLRYGQVALHSKIRQSPLFLLCGNKGFWLVEFLVVRPVHYTSPSR
jgi:hypothetical protein